MNSKQTGNSKIQIPDDWMPELGSWESKISMQMDEGMEAKFRDVLSGSTTNAMSPNSKVMAIIITRFFSISGLKEN
jgi:hypothetical protein